MSVTKASPATKQALWRWRSEPLIERRLPHKKRLWAVKSIRADIRPYLERSEILGAILRAAVKNGWIDDTYVSS